MTTHDTDHDGARDFDFWMGRWAIHNRRLVARLQGSTEWDEFEASGFTSPLPGGLGNQDTFHTQYWEDFVGMSFRFYDPATRLWSIYWADNRRGTLDPPVRGSFSGGTGTFYGDDTFEGRPIRVRFIWSRVDSDTPRWEQAFSADGGGTWETNWVMDMARAQSAPVEGEDFPVVELRRYAIKEGERENFARSFESYALEAFHQLGMAVFGQFLERKNATWFTFLRGYKNMEDHQRVKHAYYDGPVWRERGPALNERLLTWDNVLLLRPLAPSRALRPGPPVDVVRDVHAPRGIVVAQIFAVARDAVEELARLAEPAFASYVAAGAREAGLLVTLDVPNNFPRHPVRGDGPFLVWLGTVADERALDSLTPLAEGAARTLDDTGLLRGAAEWVVMDPTELSRLRWRAQA